MTIHNIMFIPATLGVDIKLNVENLNNILTKKNIRTSILQNLDQETIEPYLAANRSEDLLETIIKQYEAGAINKDVVFIPGIPLAKPYAAELNLAIAIALNAAIIFVITIEQTLEESLRQLKIVSNPYQYRFKRPLLGFIINKSDLKEPQLIEKHKNSLGLQLPFIGFFSGQQEANLPQSELAHYTNGGLNPESIQKFLDSSFVEAITPPMFKHRLIEKAKRANKKIVLPEGDEPRTLAAANICMERGIAQCILLGEKNKIDAACAKINLKLHDKITIIEPKAVIEKYIDPLYEARSAKGLTPEAARAQLADNVMLGTMMLRLGEVDGLVSGAIHTTANTIRPAFQIIKTPANIKLVSSVFFICLPDQVLVYGDCAINPDPNPEELADIAIQSANSAAAFGIVPKIAMLSYSTGTSGSGPSVDKVKAATEIVKKLRPDLEVDGPMQYDAAVSEETASIKAPNSKVAGHATVFIMPNLDVGNIIYKAVQRSTGIVCVGPMLQGLRKPVNDLSRGCTTDDIVFTIAVTAVQALGNQ